MEIQKININKIVSDKKNPRHHYEEIEELAQSIKENGQLVPMNVENLNNGQYIVVEGHRRLRALKILQKTNKNITANCIIDNKMSDKEKLVKRAAIDAQMKNLSPEERDALWMKIWDQNISEKEFAKKIGTTREQVRHFLDRANLPPNLKKLKTPAGILQETISLPKNHRAMVLKYAAKTGIGAMGIRQEVKHLKNATTTVVQAFSEQKIDIDKVKKLEGLKEDKQKELIQHFDRNKKYETESINLVKKGRPLHQTHKEKLAMTASEFANKVLIRIGNAATEMRLIKTFLEQVEPEGYDAYIKPAMKNNIAEILDDLNEELRESEKIRKEIAKNWRKK